MRTRPSTRQLINTYIYSKQPFLFSRSRNITDSLYSLSEEQRHLSHDRVLDSVLCVLSVALITLEYSSITLVKRNTKSFIS